MRTIGVLTLTLFAAAGCSPALMVEESKFAKGGEEIQCRQQTRTGSHMIRRVCTTRAEREQQSAQAREGLDRAMQEQRARTLMDQAARRQTMTPRP